MAHAHLGVVLRHVRKLSGVPAARELADGQLLDRFVRHRDDSAFAALVQRHGPMVLGVCRRVLGHEADAADAFQATFLVLVRRAGSIRQSAAVGSWLYGAAYRLALKMRTAAARRRLHEHRAATMARTNSAPAPAADDIRALLDQELSRLPEKYRAALVLHYLEGKTHAEAAGQLGWPLGSVAKRLRRGLEMLRRRLMARGLALSAAGLLASLAEETSAGVPEALAQATQRAALLAAAGNTLAGAVSAQVLAATEGALYEMMISRLKRGLVLLLALAVSGAGVGALLAQLPPKEAAPPPAPPAAKGKLEADGEPLPDGAVVRLGTLRLRHGSPVSSVAYSVDGKLIASGSWDNTIRIWDAATGQKVRTIEPKEGWIWSVAFSPDGNLLATAGDHRSKKVRLWEVATGKLVRTLEGHTNAVRSVAFAADGKSLASASSDGTVRVWDPATGEQRLQVTVGAQAALRCAAYSPDGKLLAVAGGGDTVRLFDAATGKEQATLQAGQTEVVAAAFAGDGKRLVGGGLDGTVWVWDVASGRELHRVRDSDLAAHSVAFAPDGKTFASGHGEWDDPKRNWVAGAVLVWDTATGKLVRRLNDGTGAVQAIAYAPDGKALAAADFHSGVLVWDPVTGKPLGPGGAHGGGVKSVAFTGTGTVVTASRDRTVSLWDAARGERRLSLGGGQVVGTALALSPDRKVLAWGGLDGKVRLCDAGTGRELRQLEGQAGPINAVVFAPDGKTLAAGGNDQKARLWDLASGKELHALDGHKSWVHALAFAPGGKLLASGGGDKTIRLWDAAAGKELRRLDGHAQVVSALSFSPDGRTLASASRDDSVRLWEVATGQERWRFGTPKMGQASVAFSPDGRLLATSNAIDGKGLRLWDLAGGRELCKVWGHRGFITALAFSPDGRQVASANDDSTVLLWDVARLRGRARPAAGLEDAQLETAWGDLLGDDAARAYRARLALAATPRQVLPLLKGVLKPAPATDADKVRRLIAQLDDDTFAAREKASAELGSLGGAVEDELRKALGGTASAEMRQRLTRLLDGLDETRPSAERVRQIRALELLELIGGEDAKQVLRGLTKGAAAAWLTREASVALERLEKAGK